MPKDKAEMHRRLRAQRKKAGKVDYRRMLEPKSAKELDKVLLEIEPEALKNIKGNDDVQRTNAKINTATKEP